MEMLQYAFALIWIVTLMQFSNNAALDLELGLYVNKRVPYGKEVPVVVTLSMLPNHKLTLRVSTSVYLVGYWIAAPKSEAMTPLFTHTADITKELSLLNIQPSGPITKVDVYFVVLYATFWEKSKQKLKLTGLIDPLLPEHAEKTVDFNVDLPFKCLPQMLPVKGSSPDDPVSIWIGQSNFIGVEFSETCGMKHIKLRWVLMDLMATEKLKDLFNNQFKYYIKPYSLRYPTKHELWRNRYTIQISGKFKSTKYLTRCYLKVIPEKVDAEIIGGFLRIIVLNKELLMDGSRSRDYARALHEQQFKNYHWSCISSHDPHNKFCTEKFPPDAKLIVPPYSLKQGFKYIFSLMVQSDFDPSVRSETRQVIYAISPADSSTFAVAIVCVSNCDDGYYNAHSDVLLEAECSQNTGSSIRYIWYLDEKKLGQKKQQRLQMHLVAKSVTISVKVKTSDGLQAVANKVLNFMEPPKDGNCSVSPKEGNEASTPFFVCCTNFSTPYSPLRYFYYANQVLLNTCMDCRCPAYLPRELKSIDVLICDRQLTCTKLSVGIKVNPLSEIKKEIIEDRVWNFVNTAANNFTSVANKAENLLLQARIQWVASHIKQGPVALKFITILGVFHSESLIELSKIANLTHTFSKELSPIGTDDLVVLIHSVRKLNANFQHVIDREMHNLLIKEPYESVIAACFGVYNTMHRLTKQMPRPTASLYVNYMEAKKTRKLDKDYVNKLFDEIAKYVNPEAQIRSSIWLNAMWETERLHRFLHLVLKHGIPWEDTNINIDVTSVDVHCIKLKPDKPIRVQTSDHMHEVTLSALLLNELMHPNYDKMCIRVISTIRKLNWWYPEEKQPSSVLLSVRINADGTNVQEEHFLRHNIYFRTFIGKYRPAIEYSNVAFTGRPRARSDLDSSSINVAEKNSTHSVPPGDYGEDDADSIAETGKYSNSLKSDELKTEHQIRIYRMNLDEHSMLVVRFMSSTHKLRVLLRPKKLPRKLRETIGRSKCIVAANSTNATMLLRNNCMKLERVYMAVQLYKDKDGINQNLILDTPASYSFVFQVRTCDSWSYSKPSDSQSWEHQYCMPGLTNPETGFMYCTCSLLGTYTSYAFHVPAVCVPFTDYTPVHMHWQLPFVYLVVLTVLFLVLIYLFMKHNTLFSKTVACDMTDLDRSDHEVHDLLVYIRTGGCINAGTTATVRLTFQTPTGTELQFTLMQDPENPELRRNSTFILWLRTRDIRIPTRIAVSHNNFGRYPSWFLGRIDVVDIQAQLMQIFHVRRWVRYKYLILSSALVIKPGDINITAANWRGRFKAELERQWINWGLWQPLKGSWRSAAVYDNLTRAQRVCIFVNKTLVTYCVCACVIGETTPETEYLDRMLSIDMSRFFIMTGISIFLTNLVQFLLIKLINVRL